MKENQPLFKELTEEEIAEYKRQVRKNYQVGNEINHLWHPVYREECHLMNEEAGLYPERSEEGDATGTAIDFVVGEEVKVVINLKPEDTNETFYRRAC